MVDTPSSPASRPRHFNDVVFTPFNDVPASIAPKTSLDFMKGLW
jgi:hypothetical protein